MKGRFRAEEDGRQTEEGTGRESRGRKERRAGQGERVVPKIGTTRRAQLDGRPANGEEREGWAL